MTQIKGSKAGSGDVRKPVIAPDSAQSKTYIKILYGASEGKIKGLVNGLQSIYLDDTPIHDANGNPNFQNVIVDTRDGTNDQTYIEGFEDVSSETAIAVELKSDAAWVRAFTNLDLDAIGIRLRWGPLREQNATNGDVNGITIQYAMDVQTDGGTWTEVLNTQISDKTSINFERSHRLELPKADFGWQVRVRRITPNSNSEYISDKMYVQAITEVIDAKLRYPNTALLGLQYDAETFSNVAKMAAEYEGLEILVPTNYDAETRIYSGIWDGTFKRAYTNNPAWHFYDECTAKRYALGDRIDSSMIDKWSLYRLAQYADQLVPDGKGGFEPRFTLNVYEQAQENAWTLLSKMAGVFRAFIYWDGQAIVCDADIPQDSVFTYTAANVIGGRFEYSGTRARDRHTVAKIAWDNPKNRYKTEYAFVRDETAIARLGVRIVDIAAWGCTAEGEAQRSGHWALKSEQFETRTVTFKVGLDGYIPRPGKVIEVADELFAGRANGGRTSAISADFKSITLDRDDVICRPGDRLVINGENGQAQARMVQSISGRIVTVVSAFDSIAVQNVWVVDAQDLATMKFRIISITQDDRHQFTITGLQYNPSKYDAIDNASFIDERPISIINPKTQTAVESVTITAEDMVQQGLTVATMLIAWPQADAATKYLVEWRKDDGSWMKLPITGNNSVEIQGIYSGKYQARVTAINAFDIASLATYSLLTTLVGKQGKPPKLAALTAEGILFGMRLNWLFPAIGALDTAYTEIQVSPDGIANIAQLGLFAYPTTTQLIQGMQPNLTQKYRGRLIDRIGNIGEWSEWVSGTTSADASAVLDILSGKISESQLNQDLRQQIEKIDIINGDISGLNTQIQQAKASAQKANDDLAVERTERLADVENLNATVSQEIDDRKTAVQQVATVAQKANDDLAVERTERVNSVSKLNDGLTAEIQSRKDGDTANTVALTNYKSSNDTALANVQQKAETAVTTSTANTSSINALDSRVKVAETDASTAKVNAASALTKANTAVTDSSAAASIAQQANATATSAKSTADNALSNSATAVSKSDVAVTNSSAAVSKVDAVEAKLSDYATTGALNSVDSKVTEVDNKLSATTTKVDGVYAQVNPPLIGSEKDLIGSENGFAGVWSVQSAMIEGDMALGQRIDTTVVQMSDMQALAQQEVTARIEGDQASTLALDTYISSNNLALSSVQQKAETAVTASTANTSSINALDSRVKVAETDASTAKVNAASALTKANTAVTDSSAAASLAQQANATATSAKSTADNALSNSATAVSKSDVAVTNSSAAVSKVDAVEAKLSDYATTGALNSVDSKVTEVDNKLSATTTKVDGVYAQVNPRLIGSETDLIGSENGFAGVWSVQSAMIEGDLAESIRTDQVVATMKDNDAIYKSQIKAVADSNSALVQKTETLQTTVGENTASVQEVTKSVDGIYAEKFTKIDVNGKVAGWGGVNDGVESSFIFNIDSLAIGSGDSVGYYPFIFRSTPFTDPVTGTVFPVSAYFQAAMFDYQSVKTSHIDDLAVKTGKIDNLAVTNGKIDNLAVTNAKIANLAVNTLKIQDNAVTVPVSAFAEAAQTVGSNYSTVQTLVVPADMGHTILTFGAVFSFTSYTSQQRLLCRVLKNGTVIFEDLEVHFIDYESVGNTSGTSGNHNHGTQLNITASTSDAGSHNHSQSGNTGSSSAGSVSNSNHSHSLGGSTSSSGSHNHIVNASGSVTTFLDGSHSHSVEIKGRARSAGTLSISRHDSTLIAGTFELQLMAATGGNVSVSQRYIHAMTMRK